MPELSLAELMRREDHSGLTSNTRSCWQTLAEQIVVETTEDWWGLESPTRSPQRGSSPYDGFEVLTKSSSSKPSSGPGSTLFSYFRQSSIVHLTQPDWEPSSTPPRSELLLIQTPCTNMMRSYSGANGNVDKFMEVAVDPDHGYRGYESDQLHIHSDEEPTSPVVNCIGQVRPKKSKQRCNIDKKREPGAAAAGNNENPMLPGTKLCGRHLPSPMRSDGAAGLLPVKRAARCKPGGH